MATPSLCTRGFVFPAAPPPRRERGRVLLRQRFPVVAMEQEAFTKWKEHEARHRGAGGRPGPLLPASPSSQPCAWGTWESGGPRSAGPQQPQLGRVPARRGRLAPLPLALCYVHQLGAGGGGSCAWLQAALLHRPVGGFPQERLPAHSTASVNRKSTSGSDLLFGSKAAQGIPPPLLTALQTPNTIPMTARLLWPPYPGERTSFLYGTGAGGVRMWWRGCTGWAGVVWLGGASVKQGTRDGENPVVPIGWRGDAWSGIQFQ